ncbi:MAG: ATP-binding protein [Chloroflexota bacterium]|nr:ATP-binding protein [Chloroflexota bacterium]
MSGTSLRRRFVIVTAVLCALILAFTAILAFGSSSLVVADQIEARLVERGRSAAAALDAVFDDADATVQSLAAMMAYRNSSPVAALWRTVSGVMGNADSPISRIGVIRPYRDGYQIVIFRRPRTPNDSAPLSKFFMQRLDTDAARLYAARDESTLIWMGPERGYRPFGGDLVLVGARGYIGANGQPLGAIWIEMPIRHLDATLIATANAMDETRDLATLALGDDGAIFGVYNGLETSVGRRARAVALSDALQSEIVALDPANVIEMTTEAFGAERTLYASKALLNHGNNWHLLRFLPVQTLQFELSQTILSVLVIGIIGVGFIAWLTRRMAGDTLTIPLTDLTHAAQEIGSGDMRYQIGYQQRTDEIGGLARALEDMKRDLAQSSETLQTWSRTLEKRVAERTLALENAEKSAQSVARDLRAVYDTALAVANEYDFEIVLNKLTEQIPKLMNARYCGVWLLDAKARTLRLVATTHAHQQIVGRTMDEDEGLAGTVMRTRKPLMIEDYPAWLGRAWQDPDPDLHCMIGVPLMVANIPIGAVVAARPIGAGVFSDADERLLMLLAALAAPAVRNAQLIAALDEAVKRAESANAVKTRFLASVTHELRTPLNLVINNMDFMRVGMFGDVNDEQRDKLDQTIRSAEHLLYLINDLLDVSKIEAGEMQLFIQPNDLTPVIEDALDATFGLIGMNHPVALQIELPEKLPTIEMDARRVRQILLNLLSNAVKFTKEGDIRLRVQLTDSHIEFAVSDTGIGIPPEEQERIFEAFERSRRAQDMAIEGTGLGLAISRYLVNAHHGTLTVESTIGVGTTFTFRLPLRQPDPDLTKPGRVATP